MGSHVIGHNIFKPILHLQIVILCSSVIICTINTKSYDCLGEIRHSYNKNYIRLQHISAKRSLSRWSTWNCHLTGTDIL